MRIWHLLFVGFAFFLGGISAYKYHSRFPPAIPKEFRVKPVVNKPFACGTVNPSYGDTKLDSIAETGKTLFRNNCATCHNKNMKDDLTGPALANVTEKWAEYPTEDLYKWIRNSQKMIEEKHPRALELWEAWKPTVMNDFSELSNEEIDALIAYIELIY
jgi:mono/diheme cytochrome c family protein